MGARTCAHCSLVRGPDTHAWPTCSQQHKTGPGLVAQALQRAAGHSAALKHGRTQLGVGHYDGLQCRAHNGEHVTGCELGAVGR